MSSLSLIQKLSSYSDRQTVDFSHDRCLRKRLNRCDCSNCIDVCTAGAISLGGNGISFDPRACSGCMLCTAACPNDAFTCSEFDADSLCFAEDKAELVVISCNRQRQRYPGERLVPCLGGIATEHLLALNMNGESTLAFNVSSCTGCENNHGVTGFLHRLTWFKQKSGSIFKRKCIIIKDQNEVVALDQPARRLYLSSLRKSLYETISSQFNFQTDSFKPATKTSRMIPARVRIKKLLMAKAASKDQQTISQLINYQLIVNQECNLCPLCTGICPTGAVKVERTDKKKELRFDGTLCSGCGLCVSFCKQKSLSLKRPDSLALPDSTGSQPPSPEVMLPSGEQPARQSQLERV